MELGVAIGIAIGVVLAVIFVARPGAAGGNRLLQIAIAGGAALLAGLATTVIVERLPSAIAPRSDVDRAMDALNEVPMFALLLKEVPQAKDRIREAIATEQQSPTKSGPSRPFLAIRELMRDYVAPALQHAEDASILEAAARQARIADHLQKTNLALCREYGLTGIQNTNRLDDEGRRLLAVALDGLAAAYRSGRQRLSVPVVLPSQQETAELFSRGGFTPDDFSKLERFATLDEADACALTVKLYAAPARLPADKGAPLARLILLSSYR